MVDERRMVDLFQALVRYDSESFQEKRIGQEVTKRLENLGLEILTEGATRKEYLERHPDSHPNIFARLQGTTPGEPVLFSAHLDTMLTVPFGMHGHGMTAKKEHGFLRQKVSSLD